MTGNNIAWLVYREEPLLAGGKGNTCCEVRSAKKGIEFAIHWKEIQSPIVKRRRATAVAGHRTPWSPGRVTTYCVSAQ